MDPALLKDIQEVSIDQSIPVSRRILQTIREVNNPYLYRVGDTVVKLTFSSTDATLESSLLEVLRRSRG